MKAIFIDCNAQLGAVWKRVIRPDDPPVAINTAPFEKNELPRVIGDYEIAIPHHDSAPWAQELGLAPGAADVLLKPHAGFHLDVDFDLTAGREIWTAT